MSASISMRTVAEVEPVAIRHCWEWMKMGNPGSLCCSWVIVFSPATVGRPGSQTTFTANTYCAGDRYLDRAASISLVIFLSNEAMRWFNTRFNRRVDCAWAGAGKNPYPPPITASTAPMRAARAINLLKSPRLVRL